MIPLRFPDPGTFESVRTLLAGHDYGVEAVCARTGCRAIHDFKALSQGREQGKETADGLDVLVRLFMDSEELSREKAVALLGEEGVAALEACGLLAAPSARPGMRTGSVLLYPTPEGVWTASDRVLPPELEPGREGLPGDVVYPAITRSVEVFMDLMPRTACDRFLELCSGTGIAALAAAARFAGRAWAVDITERSTVFARFNAALNGLSERVVPLQGDLWEPVRGERFDRIVAHPPYVAAPRTEYVYRDGGEDGEWITRRILEGAREHLAPGGMLYVTCMLTKREGTTLPERVREMLGPASDDFDLLVVECARTPPWEHFSDKLLRASDERSGEIVGQMRRFRKLGVTDLVFTSFLLRLHGEERPGITDERLRGPATGGAALLWGLEVARRQSDPTFPEALLGSRPRLSPRARMNVRYRAGSPGEEAWVPEGARVEVPGPFLEGMEATLAVAQFLGRCDGTARIPELAELLKQEGLLEPEVTPKDFAGIVAGMVAQGILEVESLPHPAG